MITVGNFNPIPNGSISVSPDYYYYGEEVVGGVLNLEVQGTHHASTASEYSGMIQTVLEMIDTCQSLAGSVDCGSNIAALDGTQAVVKDVSVSPGGSPLDLNYTISLECSKGSSKQPLIANQSTIDFSSIGNVIVNSYKQSVSFEDATSSTFVVNGNGNVYKSHGTYNISIDVGIYDSDRCDSNNINYKSGIANFLEVRANSLVGSSDVLNPQEYRYLGSSSKKTIGESEGSANFELIAVPISLGAGAGINALVDYTITKTTDPKTELSTTTVKGTIQGLDNSTIFLSPSYTPFSNAKSAYNLLSKERINPKENILNISCPPDGQDGGGTSTPGGGSEAGGIAAVGDSGGSLQYSAPEGTCLKKYSTRVSEFPASAKIEFETVYKEVEDCELLGYKIKTNYEERPSVTGRAEHLAPNRSNSFYPLTYYSPAVSPPKYRLTVTADMPSTCVSNPVGPSGYSPSGVKESAVLKSAVTSELGIQKQRFSLLGGNIMRTTKSITEARYSYSITEEYIKCQ